MYFKYLNIFWDVRLCALLSDLQHNKTLNLSIIILVEMTRSLIDMKYQSLISKLPIRPFLSRNFSVHRLLYTMSLKIILINSKYWKSAEHNLYIPTCTYLHVYTCTYVGNNIIFLWKKRAKCKCNEKKRMYTMYEGMFLIKMRVHYLKRKLGDGDEQTSSKLERAISYTM